jgi:hypothetical protein
MKHALPTLKLAPLAASRDSRVNHSTLETGLCGKGAATFLSPGQCQIWEHIRPFHRTSTHQK